MLISKEIRILLYIGGLYLETYVIDLETTGLGGYEANDLVLEIGIVKVNFVTQESRIVYDEVIKHPEEQLKRHKDAWIFNHSTLKYEDIAKGKPIADVTKDLQQLLFRKSIAIYNAAFDYNKFLEHPPFNLGKVIEKVLPCIMLSATDICKIPGKFGRYKWPTLEEAQKKLLPNFKPPPFFRPHRAISDAYLSALILLKLVELEKYNLYGHFPLAIARNKFTSTPSEALRKKLRIEDFWKKNPEH